MRSCAPRLQGISLNNKEGFLVTQMNCNTKLTLHGNLRIARLSEGLGSMRSEDVFHGVHDVCANRLRCGRVNYDGRRGRLSSAPFLASFQWQIRV